jgi:glutathione synthase/RimK-type ligase-like ATP-grasp enzyme
VAASCSPGRAAEAPADAVSRQRRIALATGARYPKLPPDERLILPALSRLGISAEPAVWDEAGVEWAAFDAVVIRSCWDYHLKAEAFLSWLERLERLCVPVLNRPGLLRWNADKRYLLDLAARGLPIVPTHVLPRGTLGARGALLRALDQLGADDAVVKPAVSASAHGTWRTSRATAADDGARLAALLTQRDVLVQPFVSAVAQSGEWSVICFGGAPSHAVLKRPAPGDWRVQGELGGTAESRPAPAPLLSRAARVLEAAGAEASVYARVDGCVLDDTFVLMELELIEPQLYLDLEPAAPDRFARAIVEALD